MSDVIDLRGHISIGYVGEGEMRDLALDISELTARWPDAMPRLIAERPGEEIGYIADTTREGDVLIWHIKQVDTAIPGDGSCRVYMMDGETKLGKSRIVYTRIGEAMPGEVNGTLPLTMQPLIEELAGYAVRAESAAKSAESAFEAEAEAEKSAQAAKASADSAAASASAAAREREAAERSAELAEQGAANAGWFDVVGRDGYLCMVRSDNAPSDFILKDDGEGRLVAQYGS